MELALLQTHSMGSSVSSRQGTNDMSTGSSGSSRQGANNRSLNKNQDKRHYHQTGDIGKHNWMMKVVLTMIGYQ